jgi:hypothetical protein
MTLKKLLFSITTIVLFSISGFAQIDFEKDFFNLYPREQPGPDARAPQSQNTGNYDVVYCNLELSVHPAVYYIVGEAKTKFIPTKAPFNTMYFDFTNQILVTEVKYKGNSLSFTQLVGDELLVEFNEDLPVGELHEIEVKYEGQPASSGFGSFAISSQCGAEEIPAMWTLSEPYGAKHWWPCKQTLNDKYDSIDVVITTPEIFRAASNGVLLDEKLNNDGTKTYHWSHRYPVPAYLVAFAVSEYEVYSDWVPLENGDSLEILNYIYPCNVDYAKARTPNTIPIMQFFRERFGEYPYVQEKYGHCNFGWGGGMEHSTMSFMGGFSYGLIAHELAHQWFGDKITCGSWQDIWLNEGFATYLEGLCYDFGAAPTSWENWKSYNQARATNDPTGSVYVDDTTSVNRIFNGNLSYAKGAYLLHMLRYKMGDETFFNAIYDYINDPDLAYDYALTPDLQKHLEEESGMDLDEFFKDWLYGGGYPIYEVIWEQTTDKTWLTLNQSSSNPQSVDFFDMPVPVYFAGINQDTTIQLNPSHSGQLFELDIPFVVTAVSFDPEKWICGKSQVLTSVSDVWGDELKVFPNPAGDFIKFESFSDAPISVRILDVLGRTVLHQKIQTHQGEYITIETIELQAGMYTLQLDDSTVSKSAQLIIE